MNEIELKFIQKLIEDNDIYGSTSITYNMFTDPLAKVMFYTMGKFISRLGEFKPLLHLKELCEDEIRIDKFNTTMGHPFVMTNDPQDFINYFEKFKDNSIKHTTLEKYIEDAYIKKKLSEIANNILDSLEDSTVSIRELVVQTSSKIDNVLLVSEDDILIKNGSQLTDDFIKYVESPDKDLFIPSGISVIDNVSGGTPKSALISIGANAKAGKSMTLVDSCVYNLLAGRHCVFFSIEMSDKEVFQRIASRYLHFDYSKIAKKELTEDDKKYLTEGMKQFRDKCGDLFEMYTDKNGMTVKAIEAFLLKKQRAGQQVDDVYIDYLQILSEPTKQSKPEQMEELCKQLRQLKQKTGTRLFVPCQLNTSALDKKIEDVTEDDIYYAKGLSRECDSLLVLKTDKDTGLSQMKFILSRSPYDQGIYFFPEQNLNQAYFGNSIEWDENLAISVSHKLGLYDKIQNEKKAKNLGYGYVENEWEMSEEGDYY